MKKFLLSSFALLCFSAATTQAQNLTSGNSYGKQFEKNQMHSPARLNVLMMDKSEIDNFQMEGVITEVCQAEGCWFKMNLSQTGAEQVMIKTKDHAFLLPKDIAGKRAAVHGKVSKKMVSVKEQQHYLEDAGATQEEINKITNPKEQFVMIADGVFVYE